MNIMNEEYRQVLNAQFELGKKLIHYSTFFRLRKEGKTREELIAYNTQKGGKKGMIQEKIISDEKYKEMIELVLGGMPIEKVCKKYNVSTCYMHGRGFKKRNYITYVNK